MKNTLLQLAALAAWVSLACAGSSYTPREFLREVSAASGGPEGIKVGASKGEHEAQLAALQSLVSDAPDQAGLDAANANICVLLALLGKNDEAWQVAENIKDTPTREKRKLHIVHITKGEDNAVAKLRELLQSPNVPDEDHIVYVEKLVNVLGNNSSKNEEVVGLALSVFEKTEFKDSNSEVGIKLVKFLQKAARSGSIEADRARRALEKVTNSTTETKKTAPLLDAAREALETIPAS